MEFVIDFLIELFTEVFCGVFIELSKYFVPEKKLSRKVNNIFEIVSAVISALVFVGLIIGVLLLLDQGLRSVAGWILTAFGSAWLVIGIVLFVLNRRNKVKKN